MQIEKVQKETVPELHGCNSGDGSRVARVQLGTPLPSCTLAAREVEVTFDMEQLASHGPYVKPQTITTGIYTRGKWKHQKSISTTGLQRGKFKLGP